MNNEASPANDQYINKIKTSLSEAIATVIKKKKLKQREVQAILDIKQPRVSDLMNCKVDKFSVDSLLEYLNKIGYCMEVEVHDSTKNPVSIKMRPVKTNTAQ